MHFLKSPKCRKHSAIWLPIVTPLLQDCKNSFYNCFPSHFDPDYSFFPYSKKRVLDRVTNGATDGVTDGPTDGQTLL